MRVGWVPLQRSRSTASARLRSFEPIRFLRDRGVDAGVYDRSATRPYDVAVFQKAYGTSDIEMAERLRRAGTRVVFDLCDNHWFRLHPDEAHLERVARLDRMVSAATLITTSTPELAALVTRGADVVDDALDPVASTLPSRIAQRSARARHGLLWFGNAGSADPPYGLIDLLALIPTLNEVSKDRTFTLTVISDKTAPLMGEIERTAEFPVKTASWRYRTFGALASRHLVCLLPAQQNPFTSAKTSNRAVTALRCGLAVVTGDLPSYRRLEDCLRIDDWADNLVRYLDDPSLACSDAARGRALVEARFSPAVIATQWERALTHAMETEP